MKKGVARKFSKITGKHLRRSLINKYQAGCRQLCQNKNLAQVFSCEFCEIFQNIVAVLQIDQRILIFQYFLYRSNCSWLSYKTPTLKNSKKKLQKYMYALNFTKKATLAKVFYFKFLPIYLEQLFSEHLWFTGSICSSSNAIGVNLRIAMYFICW